MYLVDSRVWIDYFTGISSVESEFLADRIEEGRFLVGDLMLADVL